MSRIAKMLRKQIAPSGTSKVNTRASHITYNFPSGFYCESSARDSTRASLTCKYQAADDGRWWFSQSGARDATRLHAYHVHVRVAVSRARRGTFPLSRNDVVYPERSDAIARMSRSRGQGRTHASPLVYLWPARVRDPVAPVCHGVTWGTIDEERRFGGGGGRNKTLKYLFSLAAAVAASRANKHN